MGKKTVVSDSQLVSKSLSVMPPDVQHERNIVASASAITHGVIIKDINKVYESATGVAKMAVKTLSLAIPRGQCVGLLGPNGAGKCFETKRSKSFAFGNPSARQEHNCEHAVRLLRAQCWHCLGRRLRYYQRYGQCVRDPNLFLLGFALLARI
jgi:hypothetical protein